MDDQVQGEHGKCVAFLAVCRAFDGLPHAVILQEIRYLGVQETYTAL